MAMAVADHSGVAWFQCINDVGAAIFNMSADELVELKASACKTSLRVLQLTPSPP